MELREQLERSLAGTFTIERELGGGGMSRVFVASEVALGRQVVVKVLPTELTGHLATDRFRREIAFAAQLQHAHIVPLLTAGAAEGQPYFTMPYVKGETLRARLASRGELPVAEAVRILREVASALAYAHAAGVVHRDIKPENVLLSGGAAMVTDFGVAKALSLSTGAVEAGLTSGGVALGTPAYMSPEQASGDPAVDHRADIYTWGVLAYELLTGATPFGARPAAAMLAAHATEPAEPVSRRRTTVPAPLAALVMRCLEKRAADRPQNAHELVAALDAIATPGAGSAVSGSVGRARSPLVGWVVAAAAVVGLGLWALAGRRPQPVPESGAPPALAVLPFENVGGDSATEFLSAGMTVELASALQKLGLPVSGDASTARFKGTRDTPRDIAGQLGVGMLLTGKLLTGRDSIRIQVQLVDPGGRLVWSSTLTRGRGENFALLDEISATVADSLSVVVSPIALAASRAGRTSSPEAHELYLRGVFEKNKASEAGLANALAYFERALKLDPNYAQAHAGIAFVYDFMADMFADSHEYHSRSLDAALKAVQADSMLAEGRALLGFELASARWDFPRGRAEINRALELNPNSADALLLHGFMQTWHGDTSSALRTSARMLQLDPLSAIASWARSAVLAYSGRLAEALAQDSATKRIDPTFAYIESPGGVIYREMRRYDRAVEEYTTFERLTGRPHWGLAAAYAGLGRAEEAMRVVRRLEDLGRTQWVDPTAIALAYAHLGHSDKAMEWFEIAFRKKTFFLRIYMAGELPDIAPIKDDPRFVALRERVLKTVWTD